MNFVEQVRLMAVLGLLEPFGLKITEFQKQCNAFQKRA